MSVSSFSWVLTTVDKRFVNGGGNASHGRQGRQDRGFIGAVSEKEKVDEEENWWEDDKEG